MPTYEYLCRACGERLEVVQSFSDDPLTVCEACGGELRKVFSAAGLIFKGSGWHVKDYAAGGAASGGTAGRTGTGSASSTATDGGTGATQGAPKKDGGARAAGSEPAAPKKDAPKQGGPSASKPSGSSD